MHHSALFLALALSTPAAASEPTVDAFLERVEAGCPDRQGVERTTEDRLLVAHLQDLVSAMAEAQDAMAERVASDDPLVAVRALWDQGRLYSGMADALENMCHPSYLNARQSEVYQAALVDKARVQHDSALETFDRALELARELELDVEIDGLTRAIEQRHAAFEQARRRVVEQPEEDAPSAQEILARIDALERTVADCSDRLDPALVQRVDQGLKQSRHSVNNDHTFVFASLDEFLAVYEKEVARGCSG